jgi:hypothetical protein
MRIPVDIDQVANVHVAEILKMIHGIFILFKLAFKTQIGEYNRSFIPNELDSFLESPMVFFHEIGDD